MTNRFNIFIIVREPVTAVAAQNIGIDGYALEAASAAGAARKIVNLSLEKKFL